ncbi:proline--tRNA ligase [bacterium]|nr:proline--tRNA ligase [bacterium]
MKYSQLFIQTFKENPADAQIVSHQLLHRAGFIQRSGTGLYNYSPLMMRVFNKATAIIHDELKKIGALEISLTVATPSELWKESSRWDELGALMVQFRDRLNRELCLSPTNEEAVVDYFRKIAKSYKQLPVCLYQINTKFRDEIRPRFGLMRAREFCMKDAYSFHADKASLDRMYDDLYKAYEAIFTRMGLTFMAVEADGGAMADSGAKTHEFHVIAASGEDELVICKEDKWAANSEMAKTKRTNVIINSSKEPLKTVDTKNHHTIKDVSVALNVREDQCIKSVLLKGKKENDTAYVMACCLGDDDINLTKSMVHAKITQLEFATDEDLKELSLLKGVIGPVNMPKNEIYIVLDQHIALDGCYVVGANQANTHFMHMVPNRDISEFIQADIRTAQATDMSLSNKPIELCRGIEVGHIFQLGDKYTKALNASILNNQGKAIYPLMGCYGIGVGRAIAAVVEQCFDDRGIIWPKSLAPFEVVIIPLKAKDTKIMNAAQSLYEDCLNANVDVILDDRDVSPGFKFKDADLIGFPIQIIIGETFKKTSDIELRLRDSEKKQEFHISDCLKELGYANIAMRSI